MRIIQLFISLFYIMICAIDLQAQDSVTIRPFWDFQPKAEYELNYVLWGEGKDMIDTVKFTNRFTAEMKSGATGNFIVSYTSQNTDQTLPAKIDGDVHSVLRFLGKSMTIELNPQGKFVTLVNADELATQLGMNSSEMKPAIMNLLLSTFFESTYGLTLTGIGLKFSVPYLATKDSIVTNRKTPAKTNMTIREEVQRKGKDLLYLKEVHQIVDSYEKNESFGEMIYLPSTVIEKDVVNFTQDGFIISVHSTNRSVSEGIKMISNGREMMNTGKTGQSLNLTLTFID